MSTPAQDQSPPLPADVEKAQEKLDACLNAFGPTFQAELRGALGVLAASCTQALEAHKRLDEYSVARDTAAPDARPLTLVERLGALFTLWAPQAVDAAQVASLQAQVATLHEELKAARLGLKGWAAGFEPLRDALGLKSTVAIPGAVKALQARVAELRRESEAAHKALRDVMNECNAGPIDKARVTALTRERDAALEEASALRTSGSTEQQMREAAESERDALRAQVAEMEKDRSEGRTAALSTIASAMGCPPESKGLMYFMGRAKALVRAESERDTLQAKVEALKSAGRALQEVLGREPEDTEEYQDAVASARDAMTSALAGPPAAVRAVPDVMKPLLEWARVTLALRDADGDVPAVDRAVVLEVRGTEHVRVTVGQLRAALKSAGS